MQYWNIFAFRISYWGLSHSVIELSIIFTFRNFLLYGIELLRDLMMPRRLVN